MKPMSLKKFVLSALFLALGIVLPFFIGQIPAIGKMLLPGIALQLILIPAAMILLDRTKLVPFRHDPSRASAAL